MFDQQAGYMKKILFPYLLSIHTSELCPSQTEFKIKVDRKKSS